MRTKDASYCGLSVALEYFIKKKIIGNSHEIVTWKTRQNMQEEYVVIGYSLEGSRWKDNNLTYRIM